MAETVDILNARVIVDASSAKRAQADFESAVTRMKASGQSSFAGIASEIDKNLNAKFKELDAQVARTEKQISSSMTQSVQSTRTFGQQFRSAAAEVATAAGIIAGAFFATTKAFKELEQAAEFRGMVMATRNMANSFGVDMQSIMEALDKASNGTLNTQEKFRLMNEAMLAGGAEVADKLPQLVEIARAASVASGAEFELVFQKLLLGIARGSAKLIDDARIYLRVGNVVEEYAKAHGIAAEEVDAHTRTTLVMSAVLADGQKIVQAVGQDAMKEADAFKQAEKATSEFIAVLKQIPVITGLVNGFTQAMTASSQVAILWASYWAAGIAGVQKLLQGASLEEQGRAAEEARAETIKRLIPAIGGVPGQEDDMRAAARRQKLEAERLAEEATKTEEATAEKLKKARDRRNELIIAAGQKMYDAEQNLLQDIEELNIDHARRLEDIAIDGAEKRAEIAVEYSRKIEDAELGYLQDLEDAQQDNTNRRIEIEQRYQERIIQIQRRFEDDYWGAVKTRDAIALVEAVRTRDRGMQDAARQRDQDLSNLDRDEAEKTRKAWLTYQRRLEDARRYYERAMDDQQRDEQRKVEDENRNYRNREAELRRHFQWRIDEIRRNLQAELDEANAKYAQSEADYAAHLQRMADIAAAYMSSLSAYSGPSSWGGAYYGGSERYRQHGGVDVVGGPTRFVAGEGGPEIVVTVPLGAQRALPASTMSHLVGGNVNHQVNMISAQGMKGMEGRIIAACVQAMREVVRG